MAIKHLSDIDLNKNQLKKARIHVETSSSAAALGSPAEGQIYYDSTDNELRFYNGSAWVSATNTDINVNIDNLKARLPQIDASVVIGSGASVHTTTSGNASVGVDLAVAGDTVLAGNLTVNGTTTTVNTTNLNVTDNIIVLNNGQTIAAPTTLRSGIEVERGTEANTVLHWNDNIDRWEVTNDGTTYHPLIYDVTKTGDALTITKTNGSADVAIRSASTAQDGIVELATAAETTAGTSEVLAVTPLGVATVISGRTFASSIGGATSVTVTHSLDTRDVIVQLYDIATFDTVVADVVRTNANAVDVSFTTAPSANAIRVLVTKI
jgi:hypothetical protein